MGLRRRRLPAWLPTGGTLPEEVWRARLLLLWLHVSALLVFALLQGESLPHAVLEASAAALIAYRRRRVSTILSSLGLVIASAVLVHLSGGTIEAHFHFFIMVGVVVLYQDWWPFVVAITFVTLHHGIAGALAPFDVYNHAAAVDHPWRWATIHGLAILGMSAAGIVNWRLNEALQRATEDRGKKLAEAQELAHLGSWERELATGWGRWSDEQYRLLGLRPQVLSPSLQNLLDRVHPDDVDEVSRTVARAWESGASFEVDFRVVLADGSPRWLHGRGEVSEWAGGAPKRMHGTTQDVTAYRLADDARRASEARYRNLVEASQEGIWSFDAYWRTTFVNRRMAEMLGHTPAEMLGQSLLGHIVEGGPASPAADDPWRREPQHDCRFRRRDGSDFWGLVSSSWESTPDGGPARGAGHRHRHHRPQAGRGVAGRGPRPGHPGVPPEVPVPRQHQPRDPDADDGHPGHERAAPGHDAGRDAAPSGRRGGAGGSQPAPSSTTSSTSPTSRRDGRSW